MVCVRQCLKCDAVLGQTQGYPIAANYCSSLTCKRTLLSCGISCWGEVLNQHLGNVSELEFAH